MPRKCGNCGIEISGNIRKIYCSKKCKSNAKYYRSKETQEYQNKQKRNMEIAQLNRAYKVCLFCSKELTGNIRKVYCDKTCKNNFEAKQAREKRAFGAAIREWEKELIIEQNKIDYPEIFKEYENLPSSYTEALNKKSMFYFTGEFCSNGHLSKRYTGQRLCFECGQEFKAKDYASSKEDGRYKIQLEKQRIREKERRQNDDEWRIKQNQRAKKWASENREHLAEYMRTQRNENPQYLIRDRIQSRLNTMLKSRGSKKSDTLENYCGCTIEMLVIHIESQFKQGMTWENKGEWEIDHIKPCALFDLTDDVQAKECFNWSNLQPLWTEENRRKSDKFTNS